MGAANIFCSCKFAVDWEKALQHAMGNADRKSIYVDLIVFFSIIVSLLLLCEQCTLVDLGTFYLEFHHQVF